MRPFALAFTLALAALGCALFTPSNVNAVKDVACIILHAWEPDSDIAKACPGFTLEEVQHVAGAHRAGVKRELAKAGACHE